MQFAYPFEYSLQNVLLQTCLIDNFGSKNSRFSISPQFVQLHSLTVITHASLFSQWSQTSVEWVHLSTVFTRPAPPRRTFAAHVFLPRITISTPPRHSLAQPLSPQISPPPWHGCTPHRAPTPLRRPYTKSSHGWWVVVLIDAHLCRLSLPTRLLFYVPLWLNYSSSHLLLTRARPRAGISARNTALRTSRGSLEATSVHPPEAEAPLHARQGGHQHCHHFQHPDSR